ncbi:MAG TPA: prepilin-type N-terminal cleavage/methylation domain-containing protein [Longimicrobium sp.]|nr:prepilin-type N-terminal cleavage/methylation domain-containing protein [Longimicrobium sp.]
MRNLRNRDGFTLIELMIVVVIIGILAAIAIPKFTKASDRAKEKEADGILKQVYTLNNTWKADKGSFTANVADLETVGFEQPSAGSLKNYSFNTDVDGDGTSYCLTKSPATATHNSRCINLTSGVLSNAAAAAASGT